MLGYLFCLTTSKSGVTNSPFSSSTADARLMFYFEEMQADNVETYVDLGWVMLLH